MKPRKTLIALLLLSLLSGCSNKVQEPKKLDQNPPVNDNSQKEEDRDINIDDEEDDDDELKDLPEPTEPGTFLVNGLDCSETADLYLLFRYPSSAAISSTISIDVYIGHYWNGTKDFSSRVSGNYLSLTYKLELCYGIGDLFQGSSPRIDRYTTVKIGDLKGFNTSDYDVQFSNKGKYITLKRSVNVVLEKEMLELSENEFGYFAFEIGAYDSDDKEVKLGQGTEHTYLYYVIKDGYIKFDRNYDNLW